MDLFRKGHIAKKIYDALKNTSNVSEGLKLFSMANLLFSNFSLTSTLESTHWTCLPGDGAVEREHAQGDAELHLPRPLCRHVLHPRGQHKVQL